MVPAPGPSSGVAGRQGPRSRTSGVSPAALKKRPPSPTNTGHRWPAVWRDDSPTVVAGNAFWSEGEHRWRKRFVHTSGRTLCEHHGRSPNAWRLRHDQKQPASRASRSSREFRPRILRARYRVPVPARCVGRAPIASPSSGSARRRRCRGRPSPSPGPRLFLCLARVSFSSRSPCLALPSAWSALPSAPTFSFASPQVSWTSPRPALACLRCIVVHFASSSGVWGALDSLCGRARNRSVAKLARRRLGTRLGREAVSRW